MEWEDLPDDGANFKCSVTTFIPDQWDCPRDAEKAMPQKLYDMLRAELPKNILLRGRAVCGVHRRMLQRDFQ